MDFLNLQTTELRHPCFSGATALQRGVWLSLQLHCVAIENGGIIANCRDWTSRQWLLSVGIEKDEVADSCDLWHFEGSDLHVWNYPIHKQKQVEIGRAQGHHGVKGGRPPKEKTPPETPPETLTENRLTPKDKGKDKEKGKGREGQQQESPADVDVDQSSFRSSPDAPQKKEGGGSQLRIETSEARKLINAALGRDPKRAFTSAEEHTLGNFAQHTDGFISVAQFKVLQAYLLAAPRYDSRNEAAFEAVPDGSLLRKRKRFASNVIEDLPNQLDFAAQWAAEGEKKEKGPKSGEPDFLWREFAATKLELQVSLPWPVLLPRLRSEILTAWASCNPTEQAKWRAVA